MQEDVRFALMEHTIAQFDLPLTAKAGIQVKYFPAGSIDNEHDIFAPHRDSHYLLMLLHSGSYSMKIDTVLHECQANDILVIVPGRVHQVVASDRAEGWSISFDPSLMPTALYNSINTWFAMHNTLSDPKKKLEAYFVNITQLFQSYETYPDANYVQVIFHLLQAILYSLQVMISDAQQEQRIATRGRLPLHDAFFKLLHQWFREWKQTRQYAAELSVSAGHLNDMVKKETGFSVSYHIQDAVVTEAKRLLFHTSMSVKEISYKLGYEDDNYFSRLFKKVTGESPVVFRKQNRDLSL